MFGIRGCCPASSEREKEERLRVIGQKIDERTRGQFDGVQFATDFIEQRRIVEAMKRMEKTLRKLCKVYAFEAADHALRAAGSLVPGDAARDVMNNACEKLIEFDLCGIQQMELICINNAFQCSDPQQFDTSDPDLAMIYEYLSVLMLLYIL